MQPHHENELRLRLERLYFETFVTINGWELCHWYRQRQVTGYVWRDIAERFDRWFETYGGQILVFRDEKSDGPYRLVFHSPLWYSPVESLFDSGETDGEPGREDDSPPTREDESPAELPEPDRLLPGEVESDKDGET